MALVRCCSTVIRTACSRLEPCSVVSKPWIIAQIQVVRGLGSSSGLWCQQAGAETPAVEERDPAKFRDKKIPVETSIQYLESKAYQETYSNNPVWVEYRRNHKGPFAPTKTRKTCIRQDTISTGNPCPICRDEYLVLDYRNVSLLEQFICPHTGSVLSYSKTGLCQKRHQELVVAVEKARDYGFLTFDVPHRVYDYSQYIKQQ